MPTSPDREAPRAADDDSHPTSALEAETARRLEQRYGRGRSRSRRVVTFSVIGAVVVVALGWLAWVAWDHSHPDVTSELVGFDAVDQHRVDIQLRVDLHTDAEASCRVIAQSEDHTAVGELSFTPTDGMNEVSIRTERLATAVEKIGCTTADQKRPR